MFRIITGGIHRRYTQTEQAAGRLSGLETGLAGTNGQLVAYRAQHEADREQLVQMGGALAALSQDLRGIQQERDTLRQALDEVAAALVETEDAEEARQRAAGRLLRHHESADLVLLADPPRVYLYLHRGQARSAHTAYEGAAEMAETYGAHPTGWSTAGQPGPVDVSAAPPPHLIRSYPVRGPWPDGARIYPVVLAGGLPMWIFGTEQAAVSAARSAFAAWRLAPHVTELDVDSCGRAETAGAAEQAGTA